MWRAGYRDGDRVRRSSVDFDDLAIAFDAEIGEIGVVLKCAHHDAVELAAQRVNNVDDQVVSQRAGARNLFDTAVDAGGFEDSNQNWKLAIPLDFF